METINLEYLNNYDPENDLGQLKMNLPPFWRLNILARLIDRGFISEEEAKLTIQGIIESTICKTNGRAGEINE